jgi:hypothetical protein
VSAPAIDGRRTDRGLFAFYVATALIALAGQTGAAVEWLHWWPPFALAAVAAVEFGGIVLSAYADHRRRLGERAYAARTLSAAVAAGAVAVNWLGHHDQLQGGFFAGMSALGYAVWLLHSGARRRDQLRATGDLPPVAPVYGWLWLRHPGLTRRARALALADATLGLYGSLAAARTAVRTERRQAAIAALLRRKLAAGRDPLAAEIAVTVYDLDLIAGRLAAGADYDGLTALIAADLTPARLADHGGGEAETPAEPVAQEIAGPADPATVAAVEAAEVHRELVAAPSASAGPVRGAAKARTSGRKKPAAAGAGKGRTSPRRSAEHTRQLAAQLRSEHPEITKAELARLLGISATRLRQVEAAEVHPINGAEVSPT